MNTHYTVKNVRGTTGLRCGCGSWLSHWKKCARSQRATCVIIGCGRTAEVGAHVVSLDRRTDRQWWIAPFCKHHNHYNAEQKVFLDSRVTLVSANKSYTCARINGMVNNEHLSLTFAALDLTATENLRSLVVIVGFGRITLFGRLTGTCEYSLK